jgi:hypothetical protein
MTQQSLVGESSKKKKANEMVVMGEDYRPTNGLELANQVPKYEMTYLLSKP